MDEEEELDYEGPLFSEDPYLLRAENFTSEESAIETLSNNADVSVIQDARKVDAKDCRDASSATASGKVDGHLGSASDRQNHAGLDTNYLLSNHRELQNLNPHDEISHSLTATTVSETKQQHSEIRNQTVQLDLSSLCPLNSISLDLITDERSLFIPGDHVNSSDPLAHINLVTKVKPRSILKVKEKHRTYNKVLDQCMSILCTVPSSSDLKKCAQDVFDNVCFDEFFSGECVSSVCLKDHYYVPNITDCNSYTVWLASLYVIRKSSKPKIEILKSLVQYFSDGFDLIKTLALAKCIPKLRHAEKLEFAQYLVKRLAGFAEGKTAVLWVLLITYPDLESDVFNVLMDGLGVFKQDSTSYLDLFHFLNFRSHIIPYRNLVKLIEDVITHRSTSENGDFVNIIVECLERLPETDKTEMKSVVSRFMTEFNVCSLDKNPRPLKSTEGSIKSNIHCPSSSSNLPVKYKKQVKFSDTVDVKISDPVITVIPNNETGMSDPDIIIMLDNDLQSCSASPNDEIEMDPEPTDYDPIFENCVRSILAVFKNLCLDWILNGDCQNPACRATHFLNEESLDLIPAEKVVLAAEFLIDKSVHPSIQVLEIFVNVINKSNDIKKLLLFRKCAPKLTTGDSLKLTKLVLSRLSRHMDLWDAIEMVLTPDLLDICNKHTDLFFFDSNLLKSVMTEAINKKFNVLRCISDEILRRISLLPSNERENIMETVVTFFRKFILNQGKLLLCPDLAPMESLVISRFSTQFESELHKGVTNNYFVVCLMLKFAIDKGYDARGDALNALYSFLNIQFSRARILNDILENCIYFKATLRKSMYELLGNTALSVILRLIEDGHLPEATEVFVVLRKFRLNLFEQECKFFQVSNFELALILCDLTVECDGHTDAIELFLNHCLQYLMDSQSTLGSSSVTQINALTEKMFGKFHRKLLWSDSLAFFYGIFSRQKSLAYPLNIMKFYERTLKTTLASPWNQKARHSCLRLFLEMEDTGVHIDLQKATYRSLFLTGVKEMYSLFQKTHSRGSPNILHPLIKKLLAVCIKGGAYSQFDSSGDQITIYSSMTMDELKIYLVWWVYYLMQAKKRVQIDYFGPVTVSIIHDHAHDEFRLPIHFTLQKVDVSIQECGVRLLKVIKSLIVKLPVTSSMFRNFGHGTFELSPLAVRELSQVVVDCLLHHTNNSSIDHLCSFCFDHSEFGLSCS